MLRKLLLASAISVLAIPVVRAADVEAPPAAYDWSGFYFGLQGGYAWGDSRSTDTISDTGEIHATAELDPEGIFGGAHAGYNIQLDDNIVLGIEADINASDIDASTDEVFDEGSLTGFIHRSELDWFGSLRARAGFAMDRFLPFVTGGLAVGHYKLNLDHGDDPSKNDEVLAGWTVGGGFEYAFSDNFTGRIEYRYADYGTLNSTFDDFPDEDLEADLSTQDVRVGVTYKLPPS